MKHVQNSYSALSGEYIRQLGSIDQMEDADRQIIARWGRELGGPILDLGCGPGHWTDYLSDHGKQVLGMDITPEFVASARANFPHLGFYRGDSTALPHSSESLAAILSWYSIIHMDPRSVAQVAQEWHRCLRAGGSVLVGFFSGSELEKFPHAVTAAYYWPTDELAAIVEQQGFHVTETCAQLRPGRRDHGHIIARKI